MVDLKQVLLNKWQQKKLAHFYILEPTSNLPQEILDQELDRWVIDFLGSMLKEVKMLESLEIATKKIINIGNPDVLLIGRDKEASKPYLLEEFEEFFRFLNFATFELPHKFVVIYHGGLIDERLSNKLLKSLEEPGKKTTIFLLNNDRQKLLPTISSRAIKLRLPFSKNVSNTENMFTAETKKEWIINNAPECLRNQLTELVQGNNNPYQILDELKNDVELELQLEKFLLEMERHFLSGYKNKDLLIKNISQRQRSRRFHTTSSARLFEMIYTPL
ncbi:MAG: hypothetical protein ACOCUH_04565 [Bacteriovoracia bacterium]